MITARQVQLALRKLRPANMTPEEFADEAGVDRSTVYRIDGDKVYTPKIETIAAIVESRDVSLSEFFLQIEGLSPTGQTDQESPTPTPPELEANHGRDLSAAERADLIVQRTFIAALAEEIVGAVDRLVEARTANQPTRSNHASGARKNSRSSTR